MQGPNWRCHATIVFLSSVIMRASLMLETLGALDFSPKFTVDLGGYATIASCNTENTLPRNRTSTPTNTDSLREENITFGYS